MYLWNRPSVKDDIFSLIVFGRCESARIVKARQTRRMYAYEGLSSLHIYVVSFEDTNSCGRNLFLKNNFELINVRFKSYGN